MHKNIKLKPLRTSKYSPGWRGLVTKYQESAAPEPKTSKQRNRETENEDRKNIAQTMGEKTEVLKCNGGTVQK